MAETPYNLDAEICVLGSVLIDNESIKEIAFLAPSDFGVERHRTIYGAVLEMHEAGTPIDFVTLGEHLGDKKLKEVGGVSYISQLADKIPSSANIVHHANIVKQAHKKYSALQALREAERKLKEAPSDCLDDVIGDSLSVLGCLKDGTGRKVGEYYFDLDEIEEDENHQCHQNHHQSSPVIKNHQKSSVVITESSLRSSKAPYNLAAIMEDWVRNSTGSFTNDQVDREFDIHGRPAKNNRARVIQRLLKKELIKADKRIKGKYHIINTAVEWVDITSASGDSYPLLLPFGLHEKVHIPSKSIIVLAGSTNAGKTTFILKTLFLNRDNDFTKLYVMSEMGPGQYRRRVQNFEITIDDWQSKIKAIEQSYDFNSIIQHHNRDGLTCIDFLEEVDGEYYKIPSSIRDIYDSLGEGVAFIAIQKSANSQFGRGGEGTREKACLYMTLDYLCSSENCIYCALRLTKVKESLHENMQDKELHFRIEHGARMEMVMDWTYASKVNRSQCIQEYETGYVGQNEKGEYRFKMPDGTIKTLFKRDAQLWIDTFQDINVERELERLAKETFKKPWMAGNWFYQLGGELQKLNVQRGR